MNDKFLYRNDLILGAMGTQRLSVRELAEKTKVRGKRQVSTETINRVQRGGNTTVKTLRILSRVLGINYPDLFTPKESA